LQWWAFWQLLLSRLLWAFQLLTLLRHLGLTLWFSLL
jgi:hypothetical protein